MSPDPTTYHAMAQTPTDDELGDAVVTGASPKPYGHNLAAPSWAGDPTGPEPPLGFRVDDVPLCSGIGGIITETNPAIETEADDEPQTD